MLAIDRLTGRLGRRRFGFSGENGVTLDRLAGEFGLSREVVRRIEKRALKKLRQRAVIEGLEGSLSEP